MEEKTKLNMQMYDAESILAPLQKLNLMDDFLFDAALPPGIWKHAGSLSNCHWASGSVTLPGKKGRR